MAILCRYLEEMQTVRLTYLEPRPGLRLAQSARNELRRQARLRQAEDADHPAVATCAPTPSSFAGPTSTCAALLPTADEVKAFLADKAADKRAKLIDTLLGTARVRRLLDAQVVGRVAHRTARRSRSRASTSSSTGCATTLSQNTPLRRGRPRVADGQRQHLRQPAGQLLPHRPRPDEPGRDDGPAVLRHPHAVRQVPQPPVRALGRRTTTTAWPRSSPA